MFKSIFRSMFARCFLLFCLAISLGWPAARPPRALAATGTFTVNSTADSTLADNYLTLREALLLARGSTTPGSGLGRPLTAGEQAQTVGCSFDASGNILNSSCGNQVLDFVTFDASLANGVWINLLSPLPKIDDTQPTFLNGGSVKPTLSALGAGGSAVLEIQSAGNVIEHIGVANAPLIAFDVPGDDNTLYDVWAYAGDFGVSIGGQNNLVKDSHIGAVNNGACWVTSQGNGIHVLGINNKIDHSEVACSDQNGIELSPNASGTILSSDVIHDNAWDGISERPGASLNQWTQVSLYSNGGLGIDKNANFVLNNEITGPYPLITSVSASAGQITVSGTATASLLYLDQVEVYAAAPDPTGYGEGRTYLGVANVNNTGHWTMTFPGAEPGCYTALQGVKNQAGYVDSSEFGPSSCRVFVPMIIG
jgi:hypothetical protein